MDNFLIQVRGRKRAVLFHPNDLEYLYMKGELITLYFSVIWSTMAVARRFDNY